MPTLTHVRNTVTDTKKNTGRDKILSSFPVRSEKFDFFRQQRKSGRVGVAELGIDKFSFNKIINFYYGQFRMTFPFISILFDI